MTTDVMAVLVVATVAIVVWFTIGRTMLAVAAAASEIPVGPALSLFADSLCALRGVRVVEIVVSRDDVLVGFAGGEGSWLRRDEAGGERVVVVDDEADGVGELCLRHAARDARSRRLLESWRTERRALTAVMNEGLGLAALVDEVSREALIVDLAYNRHSFTAMADRSTATATISAVLVDGAYPTVMVVELLTEGGAPRSVVVRTDNYGFAEGRLRRWQATGSPLVVSWARSRHTVHFLQPGSGQRLVLADLTSSAGATSP